MVGSPWQPVVTTATATKISLQLLPVSIKMVPAILSQWQSREETEVYQINLKVTQRWASLVAQLVKNPPVMWETGFDSSVR